MAWAIALTQCWGCAHGPRNFRKIQNPAPLVRARAVGLGGRKSDSQVVPALVGRLGDSDPVVRLAAYEELRRRTGATSALSLGRPPRNVPMPLTAGGRGLGRGP